MDINRVIEVLKEPIENSADYWEASDMAIEALRFQQSVVRCVECINHSEPKVAQRWWCNALDISVAGNDFCSNGERRGD